MAKGFLEVFPDLHMTTEMEELLKLVDVERVSSTRDLFVDGARLGYVLGASDP